MGALLSLVQIVFRPAGDHVLLVKQVILQHIQKIQHLRLVVHQGQHDYAVGILELGVLVELVQDHVGVGVLSQLDIDPHTLTAGLVADVSDAVDALFLYQVGDLFDQTGLVYHVGKLRHHNAALSIAHGLDIRHCAHADLAPAGAVSLLDAPRPQNFRSCGEIRTFYNLQNFFDGGIPILFDPVIDQLYDSLHHLPEIVGRDVRRHSHGDACGAVHQQVRITGGKHGGLLLGLVEVRDEIYGVFIDVRQHLHGNLAQAGLGITHGRRPVPVLGSEVSMAVHQRIAGRPVLGHIDQGSVDGAVSMGVVFTHGIADDTGAFSVRLIRTVVQLDHGVKNPSLHRL